MLSNRSELILSHLQTQGAEVHLSEIKALFPSVSESTLRRDLDRLAEAGRVIRTYGGVLLAANGNADDVLLRQSSRLDQKKLAAQAALTELTSEHHVIYIDAGSTCACLARILPEGERMLVTNDPSIAVQVARKPGITTLLLGGMLNPSTLSVAGQWSLQQLDSIHIDLAFMGTSGMAADTGFTNLNAVECDLKTAVIDKARRAIVLCDSGKFNLLFPFTFARFNRIGAVATDVPLPEDLAAQAAREGMANLTGQKCGV